MCLGTVWVSVPAHFSLPAHHFDALFHPLPFSPFFMSSTVSSPLPPLSLAPSPMRFLSFSPFLFFPLSHSSRKGGGVQVEEVQRFVEVHGQIILNQFRNFPNRTVQHASFVAALRQRLELRRHHKVASSPLTHPSPLSHALPPFPHPFPPPLSLPLARTRVRSYILLHIDTHAHTYTRTEERRGGCDHTHVHARTYLSSVRDCDTTLACM